MTAVKLTKSMVSSLAKVPGAQVHQNTKDGSDEREEGEWGYDSTLSFPFSLLSLSI